MAQLSTSKRRPAASRPTSPRAAGRGSSRRWHRCVTHSHAASRTWVLTTSDGTLDSRHGLRSSQSTNQGQTALGGHSHLTASRSSTTMPPQTQTMLVASGKAVRKVKTGGLTKEID